MLKSFNIDNFPLQQYILYVNDEGTRPTHPSYVNEESNFMIPNGFIDDDYDDVKVELLSNHWPDKEDLNMDESQYDAFRAALTKKMVVIQGPPGNLI